MLAADTHQPSPNAQLGIAGNTLGTSTNTEGCFALRYDCLVEGRLRVGKRAWPAAWAGSAGRCAGE